MSYRYQTTTRKDGAFKALDQVLTNDADTPTDDHVQAALLAVDALLPVVGTDDDVVDIVIHGHANPGHLPREGWADETLTVTITVKPADATTVEAAAGDEATEDDGTDQPGPDQFSEVTPGA